MGVEVTWPLPIGVRAASGLSPPIEMFGVMYEVNFIGFYELPSGGGLIGQLELFLLPPIQEVLFLVEKILQGSTASLLMEGTQQLIVVGRGRVHGGPEGGHHHLLRFFRLLCVA